MADDVTPSRGRKRIFVLVALAIAAAAFGRQIALGSADRKFEAKLRSLDQGN